MSVVQSGDENKHEPATRTRVRANTFRSIRLDPHKFADLPFATFVQELLAELEQLKRERSAFYEQLRRSNSRWANGARGLLAILGALALFLTALVAAVRFAPGTVPILDGNDADKGLLVWVLVIYAVMGAISFYERGSDKTTAYFRQIAAILAMRDLWTKLQFAVLKELRTLATTSDAGAEATRTRILTVAETFCTDLDKIATGELAEFRTEFLASLAELQEASQKGVQELSKQLEDHAKAAEKAAADARAAAEKAAADAKAAEKAAADAAKPGFVNLSIVGDFDDEVVISIAGAEVARSTGKAIGIERIPPGLTTIAARSKKGTKVLDASMVIDVKPGLQECRLTLS
jgi:hypothetical protein